MIIHVGGVRNPMKMSDIGFLKTKPNRTYLKIHKPKTRFPRFGFQKNDFGSLRTVFHVVSFTVHLLTDQDQQSKYFFHAVRTSSSESLQLTISWTNSAWKYVILASYCRGVNERWCQRRQTNVGLTELKKKTKPRLIQ